MSDELITDSELDTWDHLCKEATEGPWSWLHDGRGHYDLLGNHHTEIEFPILTATTHGSQFGTALFNTTDFDFIAACRTALPRLIAEIRSLRKLEEIRKRESSAMISRISTGEGEPRKYLSVPEMLADLKIKDLEEEVEALKKALVYWMSLPVLSDKQRREYIQRAQEIGLIINEVMEQNNGQPTNL